MKLSAPQQRVLSAIELHAERPIDEVASRCGVKPSTVKYHLKQFRERDIIGKPRPIIDTRQFGISYYTVFFTLNTNRYPDFSKIFQYLLTQPEVSWLFSTLGEYHYAVSLLVRNGIEVAQFLSRVSQKFPHSLLTKTWATQLSFHYYGNPLLREYREGEKIGFDVNVDEKELSEEDRKLISVMTQENNGSVRELAETMEISASTFERRKSRLRSNGIIRGYYHWVDPKKFQLSVFVVLLKMRGLAPEFRNTILNFAERERKVMYVIESFGEWDFEIGVAASLDGEVIQVIQELYKSCETSIDSSRLLTILEYQKFRSLDALASEPVQGS